jgi:primosomal protein N' (replication factor Y) (superfamily II helicase)
VVVDLPLPHLDRVFDYTVPEPLAADARPGVRVRVRFAGQDVDGYLVERVQASEHEGRLAPLRRVVSPEPVLAPQVLRLARAVADRYAGTLSDVLRLAVPPRHARTEQEPVTEGPPVPVPPPDPGPWADYPAGPALLAHLASGDAPRAVWTALPGPGWTDAVATAVQACRSAGRGALVVLPDGRDVALLEPVLRERLGAADVVRLEADLGPAARYRAFLRLLRGRAGVAVGTRAAAFAPVRRLGLVLLWEDGDDLHAEPRAPYPHAREVLALRSELEAAALVVGGWGRTAETAAWLGSGWARPVVADRAVLRRRWPMLTTPADAPGAGADPSSGGRLPEAAWRALREGLARGPVLVQVPRAGYQPGLACQTCRRPARCPECHGPLHRAGAGAPECRWCGRQHPGWSCPHCRGSRLRASAVGADRTAEELGRAFPGVPVLRPQPGAAAPRVPQRALVVATPGLEPPVPDGYAAAVLLDGWSHLERPDLRAGEQAVRRWLAAAALVRPRAEGGAVVLCADPGSVPVQAALRTDPGWYADRDLAERAELGFPPAVAMASVTGPPAALDRYTQAVAGLTGVELLGPVPVEPSRPEPGQAAGTVRLLLRVPTGHRAELSRALAQASAGRSARREAGSVRVQVDPPELG